MRHNFIVSIMAALILSASCALQSCSVDGSDGQSRILKIYDSWFYARSCSSADENSLLDGEPYNGCQRVSLPHYVNPPADSSFNSYYLRKFFVPPYMDGKRVSLHFGGVTSNACVWLNGELLADSLEPYKPFALDIKPRKGENCVLLKLDKGGMMHSGAYICGSDSLCFTFADEFIEGNGITFIEWPVFIEPLIPTKHIEISIKRIDDNVREIEITDLNDNYKALFDALEGK